MTDFIVILLGFESIDVKIHFRNYELCVRFMVSSIWCRKLNWPRWSTRARTTQFEALMSQWKIDWSFFFCKPIITPTDFVIVHRFRQAWLRVSLGFVTFVCLTFSTVVAIPNFFFLFCDSPSRQWRTFGPRNLWFVGPTLRQCLSFYTFNLISWEQT